MNKKLSRLLSVLFVIFIVGFFAISFFSGGLEHIEDTNGAENTTLTTITDSNIIKLDTGALAPVTISRPMLSDGLKFSSKKFTGVYEVLYNNYIGASDFELDLTSFTVTEGNFKMAVVHNEKIVAVIEPDTFVNYRLENISGTVSLRIAGESAAYEFYMSEHDYENFAHP